MKKILILLTLMPSLSIMAFINVKDIKNSSSSSSSNIQTSKTDSSLIATLKGDTTKVLEANWKTKKISLVTKKGSNEEKKTLSFEEPQKGLETFSDADKKSFKELYEALEQKMGFLKAFDKNIGNALEKLKAIADSFN